MSAETQAVGLTHVAVDLEVCEASGVCARMVKEVFDLDDEDILHITRQPDTEDLAHRVGVAVRRCPKQALRLISPEPE